MKPESSLETKKSTGVISRDTRSKEVIQVTRQSERIANGLEDVLPENTHGADLGSSTAKGFDDYRWRNGSWDLKLFVKDGKMDWDGVITAEARRRKFLEMYPEPATNTAPVLFRSSIIPWWAWFRKFHLPEAEQLNGRAAMVGFFMAYSVDALTGLGVVDQMSNSICKACLLMTVSCIILLRRTQDVGNLQSLINEAAMYDKRWQTTWKHSNESSKAKQDEKEIESCEQDSCRDI